MYFLYITTNKVNNKKYVGLCSMRKNNWETYLGSGKILKRAIKKNGAENFEREIISYFDNLEDVIKAEYDYIIQNNCHLNENWYNIATGFTTLGFKGKKHSEEWKLQRAEYGKKRPPTENMKQNMARVGSLPKNPNQIEASKENGRTTGLKNKGRTHKKALCINCNKEFGPGPYSKFHGEKCKSKAS